MQNKIKKLIQTKAYLLLFVLLLFTQGYSSPEMVSKVPLVVVNGDTISTSYIDQMIVKTHRGLSMSDKQSFDYDKLLTKAINDYLILQEAFALGLDDNEQLQLKIKDTRKEIVRKLYLSHAFNPNIVISDKEINDFYAANLISYQFRTISLNTLEEANEVYALLQQGRPFDSLATERSQDHRRFKKGLHSVTFKMNVDAELLNNSESLEVKQYSKPVKYQHYYTIIKLEKREPANFDRLETFRQKIIDKLTEDQKEVAWYKFMDNLRAKYPVSVDSTILEEIKADKDMVLQMEFRQGTENPALLINDEFYITDNQLRTEISHNIMNAGTTPFEIILVNSLNNKQEDLLSTYAAVQNGYWDSTRVVDWYYKELDSSLIEIYLNEMIVSKITFNKEDFKEYYEENKESFRNTDQFLLDHMMIKDHVQAHEAADALKDGAQWSYIFKKYNAVSEESIESKEWMSIDKFLDEIKEELYELKPGQTSSAFTVSEGFIIFRVKDRKPGNYKSIGEVDLKIREVMFQRNFSKLLDEHIAILKENSQIEYFDDNIKTYFGK